MKSKLTQSGFDVYSPEFIGRIPVRTELTVLPADMPAIDPDDPLNVIREVHEEPKQIGFTIEEKIGVGYVNSRGLKNLKIDRK